MGRGSQRKFLESLYESYSCGGMALYPLWMQCLSDKS